MKYVSLILILQISVFADIDSQIDKIKNAPVDERFLLMNEFKKEMIKMREDERFEALKKLKKMSQPMDANMTDKMIQEGGYFDSNEFGLDDVDIQSIEDKTIDEIETENEEEH